MDTTLNLPLDFERAYPPAEPPPGDAHWLVFRGKELVVTERGATV